MNTENYNAFEVGEIVCSPRGEGVVFDLSSAGGTLAFYYSQPTDNEIKQIKTGRPKFKIAVANEIMFLLSKFGDLAWTDAPFSIALTQITPSDLENIHISDGIGLSLHVMLVDCATGRLKANRLIGLGSEFSRELLRTALRLPIQKNLATYLSNINAVYNCYRTTDLVKRAIATNAE